MQVDYFCAASNSIPVKNKENILQQILDNRVDHKKVFGTSFCIRYKGETWCGASGNLTTDSPYFIASTTKLFITALILNFREKRLLELDDLILNYLDEKMVTGLNRYKGTDHSNQLTIRHLLAHTSGIADYFQGKNKNGNSLEKDLIKGNDQAWSFEEAVRRSKSLPCPFPPGKKGKALYSDTNFQLLGKIIETVSGKSLEENLNEQIIRPLGLSDTYLYKDILDTKPHPLYYRNKELHIPKAMASFTADGGIVSTSREMMRFSEAFFNGQFFPESTIAELKTWNRIFFPVKSGTGIHQFRLPWFFDPAGKFPELIGHSGLSGALAYCCPEKDLYITGTVNQVAYPDLSFRLAIKLIQNSIKK